MYLKRIQIISSVAPLSGILCEVKIAFINAQKEII